VFHKIFFTITGGKIHDSKEAKILINHISELEILISDKRNDNKILRECIEKNTFNHIIQEKVTAKSELRSWEQNEKLTKSFASKYNINK
jgi:hypothetical protein